MGFFMVLQPAPLQTLSGWEEFSARLVEIWAPVWDSSWEPSVGLGAEDLGLNPSAASLPL